MQCKRRERGRLSVERNCEGMDLGRGQGGGRELERGAGGWTQVGRFFGLLCYACCG